MQVKNSFATLVNELSVLKLFQLSNGDLLFSKHDYSLYKVRKPRMTKLGQGVGVRAHYPTFCFQFIIPKYSYYYNYLQLLCREIIEFLLYRGFPRPIWPAKYHERSEGYFAGQIGQGNPRWSKNFNFPKKLLYTILSSFGITSKRW